MRNGARWPQQAEMYWNNSAASKPPQPCPQQDPPTDLGWRQPRPSEGSPTRRRDLQNVAVTGLREGEEAAQQCQQSSSQMLWKWDKGVGKTALQQWWGTGLCPRQRGRRVPGQSSAVLKGAVLSLQTSQHIFQNLQMSNFGVPLCKFTWASECKKEILWINMWTRN